VEEIARPVFAASVSLLAGYAFLWLAYFRRFSVEHLRSDRFAFYLLGWAFAFFILGDVAANLIPAWSPPMMSGAWDGLRAAGVTASGINAIVFGVLAVVFENLRVLVIMRTDVSEFARRQPKMSVLARMRFAAAALYILKSSNAALQTCYRATVLGKPVLLTLKSHKVYVGKIYTSLEDPSRDFTYIKILPTKSGYRDRATKKVSFPTRYKDLLQTATDIEIDNTSPIKVSDLLQRDLAGLPKKDGTEVSVIDLNDMGVVISWKEIETLSIFDESVYRGFQQQGPPGDEASTPSISQSTIETT
jgi:hypothetical protein